MPIVTQFSDLDLSKQYSYADYLLWQFSERVELIKGFIKKMSPSPSMSHQTVSQNLAVEIHNYLKKGKCRYFTAPFDVRLPIANATKDTTVVQPDLCIICDESKLDERGCNGVPDLIVEILSNGNSKSDVDTKYKLYEEAGVKEYWIIETNLKIVFVYTLIDGKYIGLAPQTEGSNIVSPLFPDFEISLDDVFYRV